MEKDTVRGIFNLNLDWRFYLGEAPKAWQKGFDDSNWQIVNLPHDWSVEHPFDTCHSSGTGYLPAGTGMYRKCFYLPKSMEGKRVYVLFDGVYNNSMVWCNSYYLGKRPFGYTEFTYDITDFACFGDKPNVLTVRVDHRYAADSRWFTGSGIYRKVTVVVKEQISIDHHGIFVFTQQAASALAKLTIQTSIRSSIQKTSDSIVRHLVYDENNVLVSSTEGIQRITPCGTITDSQIIEVDNPRLWSTETPTLYTCITEIEQEGVVIDRETTITGIRTFAFDPNKGFFLNGENMKLKGVCVHHDAGCLGAAVRKKVWKRRLLSLKDMGANAIRMSHNPHMPELYDLCDELGFLVIDEAFDEWEGVKNKWFLGHNVYPPAHYGYYEDFPEWHERDLEAMVLRDRNHPSVILWSIGNEIDYPNDPYCHASFETMTGNNDANKPATERMYDSGKPSADRLPAIARELVSIVKKHDTTRPVTAALAFPELSSLTGLAACLDVVGYNYKEHLYHEDHKEYPDRVLMGSENGKELDQWLAVKNNDFISGQFLWTGIDFLGETRGWPSHGSEAGLLDIAGFEKTDYYFRKSLWYNKPMVKLFAAYEKDVEDGRYLGYHKNWKPSWDFMEGEAVRVLCFTNCETAELFLNGRSIGVKRAADADAGYRIWELPYENGTLKVVAIDQHGHCHEDVLFTTGDAVELRLICAEDVIQADGLDMTHVVLEIIDGDGNRVADAQDLIHVTLEGPGAILGLENGNLEDTTPYPSRSRRAHNGRLLIYVSSAPEPGCIIVRAQTDILGPKEVQITSH